MAECGERPKRAERFTHLVDLCPAISLALSEQGLESDQIFLTFRDCVKAECKECGTVAAGEELFVLSQPQEGKDLNTRLHRLRLGFCANSSCMSFDCALSFNSAPRVDWQRCLNRVDRVLPQLRSPRSGFSLAWRRELVRPALIGVSSLVLILLIRQIYVGGRIPLVREPEQFRVTPATVEWHPDRQQP